MRMRGVTTVLLRFARMPGMPHLPAVLQDRSYQSRFLSWQGCVRFSPMSHSRKPLQTGCLAAVPEDCPNTLVQDRA